MRRLAVTLSLLISNINDNYIEEWGGYSSIGICCHLFLSNEIRLDLCKKHVTKTTAAKTRKKGITKRIRR